MGREVNGDEHGLDTTLHPEGLLFLILAKVPYVLTATPVARAGGLREQKTGCGLGGDPHPRSRVKAVPILSLGTASLTVRSRGGPPHPFLSLCLPPTPDHEGTNPCSVNNGDCSQLCLPTSESTRSCMCTAGYSLRSGQQACEGPCPTPSREPPTQALTPPAPCPPPAPHLPPVTLRTGLHGSRITKCLLNEMFGKPPPCWELVGNPGGRSPCPVPMPQS